MAHAWDDPTVEPSRPDRARLVVVWGELSESLTLPQSGEITFGRSPEADVRIDHPSVSRLHFKLILDDGVELEDLGSAHGTRVAGRAVTGRVRLSRGMMIEAGDAVCILQAEARAGGASQSQDDLIARIAPGRISVLILGETGVGKEVMAARIHRESRRADQPMVKLNCAALSEALVESELFGHKKGAFTGAVEDKVGLFEAAAGGTIFLDEVGELSAAMQAKLLRALEDRVITRVGEVEPRPVDVRFLSATNRDLQEEVKAGRFRQDLFFRLNGISIAIPPLRERTAEIAGIAQTLIERIAQEEDRAPPRMSAAGLASLQQHPWPGNIREMRNVLERAVLLADEVIEPEHLAVEAAPPSAGSLQEELRAIERSRIVAALEAAGGNQTKAAEALGMSRRTFVKRLTEYEIRKPRKG